jgi:hypothetical protein
MTLWALISIGAAGWLLRALPLIQSGAFGYPIDYDEGVYFASSALLVRGALPYRDFVFVHPPALLYFLAPAAWLGAIRDPAFGFAAARWLATIVGCANILLLGRLVLRWAGPVAAIVAAAVYATHPAVAAVERGPFLEPVLNLSCLALAYIWLSNDERSRSGWSAVGSGVLCGVAVGVKLSGAMWLLACLLSLPTSKGKRALGAFCLAALATWAALVAALFFASPGSFWTELIGFHAVRPPDGTLSRFDRLSEMLWGQGLLAETAVTLFGLGAALLHARDPARRAERLFASVFLLILCSFLLSSTYWRQYNSHLAMPGSAIAGYGGAQLWGWAARSPSKARLVLASALLAIAPVWGTRRSFINSRARSPAQCALGHFLRDHVPTLAPLLSFEPAWALAAGRLPDKLPDSQYIVDSYATMLLDAARSPRRFGSASEAFHDPSSQAQMRAALEACRFALVGGRGSWQMSPQTQEWFRAHFIQRFPPAGREGIDVWERER